MPGIFLEAKVQKQFVILITEVFLATDLSTVAAEPEGTEVLELRWVTPEIAKEMIVRGEISDALTVIALSRIDSVTPGRIVT